MKAAEKLVAKPVKVKQTGKVIGMIITECPMCKNTISFDVQTSKYCPYCNAEISVDLDRVEVSVRAIKTMPTKGSQKRVA